jgi:hypothetical protein
VVGYNLYYGGATQTYTNTLAVGSVTNAAISGLLPGAEYFFAATAVDGLGVESVFSNEISYQVPTVGELIVTADNLSRTYGAANPTLSGSMTGLQNGDNITGTLSTAATPASPVGTYSIVPTLIDPDGKLIHYNVTINNGTLTVNPAALTITAASTNKLYGAPLPALTASYSGFVNGDTASSLTTPPALSTTATTASPVGSYPITASGAASPNYTISYASGTLSVNPAALTITAASTNKLYGAPLPALTASYSGFVNGDTASSLTTPPALSTTATTASPVGSYPITASGAAGANYTFIYTPGTLVVTSTNLAHGSHTVDITVDNEPSRNLAIISLGNGSVAIGGEGIPGRTFIIQYTTRTLPTTNWLTLGTVTADSSGAFVLVETAVSGLRFYRAIYP